MADFPLSSEAFDVLLDRVACRGGDHEPATLHIVHTPGFFDDGPRRGIGCSTLACGACTEPVQRLLQGQYGGSERRALRR